MVRLGIRLLVLGAVGGLLHLAALRLRRAPAPWFEGQRRLQEIPNAPAANKASVAKSESLRILYIVTSLHEFDDGRRATHRGYDRFRGTLLPALGASARSLRAAGFVVDVYLIAHYTVPLHRRAELRRALGSAAGGRLTIWDDATPLGYDTTGDGVDAEEAAQAATHVGPILRGLARQHRYVVKDHLRDYDVFLNFEDDMVVTAEHVWHYLRLTQDWYDLRRAAPDRTVDTTGWTPERRAAAARQQQSAFYGPMNRLQLARLVPGFIRVEAALDDYRPHRRNLQPQIPLDFGYDGGAAPAVINASVCCHLPPDALSAAHLPPTDPTADQLFFWETSLEALGLRRLPDRRWALLLGGGSEAYYDDPNVVVGDYWAGRDHGYFGDGTARPDKTLSRYVSNQGGWMATRRQVAEWHAHWCRDGFLPPFERPHHEGDGLATKTVEYWSGGIQIAGVLGCNLQRAVVLDPDDFGKHLLYHSANNKQKVKNVQYRFSSRSIQEFWGQLNTIRKNAQRAMELELNKKQTSED